MEQLQPVTALVIKQTYETRLELYQSLSWWKRLFAKKPEPSMMEQHRISRERRIREGKGLIIANLVSHVNNGARKATIWAPQDSREFSNQIREELVCAGLPVDLDVGKQLYSIDITDEVIHTLENLQDLFPVLLV